MFTSHRHCFSTLEVPTRPPCGVMAAIVATDPATEAAAGADTEEVNRTAHRMEVAATGQHPPQEPLTGLWDILTLGVCHH